jgi:acetyl esterase/lipase
MLVRLRLVATLFAAGLVLAAADTTNVKSGAHYNIPLWDPGKVPLAAGDGPLDSPFLTVFTPRDGKGNGTSVIVAPGGGNIMLMYGLEGLDIAERFNDWGSTAFVLTYRLSPKYGDDARVLDGNRAVQLVRSRAKEWDLDPQKVGLAGFSAGSSMARLVAAAAKRGDPNATDPLDRASSRPDWLVLVYGPGSATPLENLKAFPPTFLLSAAGDRGAADGTAQLFLDMNRAGATAELHVYQKGRHGFGAASLSPEFSPWMDQLRHFLRQDGFLPKAN